MLAAASWSYILAPTLLVIATVFALPGLFRDRPVWLRRLICAAVLVVLARYVVWRVTDTLVLDRGAGPAAWSILCLAIEVFAYLDQTLLYVTMTRESDRSAEADAHQRRMESGPPDQQPSVDVFITTYNEPLEILEKTIVGALSLEWPQKKIYVLDDGRRAWLQAFCAEKGVGYITRPDNRGAKAGNINHALKQTRGAFVAIFDADFVPQRQFLKRTMGFFDDPRVGIVQTPHTFYNPDPLQSNLAMQKSVPDDQRLFFESIMASRDAWDAAFCCGSNSVTRRAALDAVGGGLPEDTITEDIMLTVVLLRKGFVTRYLCEPLAFGLAPESVEAFYVQRLRWARGAIQMLFLKAGPLTPGLRLMQRLLFIPTHWLTNGLISLMALIVPLAHLLLNLAPMRNIGVETTLFYVAPTLLTGVGGMLALAPGRHHPLAAQVLGTLLSFKLVPTVVMTLIRPKGHSFKVTPKGAQAAAGYERNVFLATVGLMAATVLGLGVNLSPEWRIVEDPHALPVLAFWSIFNLIVLFLVGMLCLQTPVSRDEERFALSEPVLLRLPNGRQATAMSTDISLSGVGLITPGDLPLQTGERLEAYVSAVGWIEAEVARTGPVTGLKFRYPEAPTTRDLMIRKVFTGGRNTIPQASSVWQVTFTLLARIFTADVRLKPVAEAPVVRPTRPPDLLPPRTLVIEPPEEASGLDEALETAQRVA